MNKAADRPCLRPDVAIFPFSSSAREGTFLLVLPDGRCLLASPRLYELIRLLDGKHSLEEVAARLSDQWPGGVSSVEVRDWLDRALVPHGLIRQEAPDPKGPAAPSIRTRGRKGVSLIPAWLLQPVTGILRILFQPAVALPVLGSLIVCHILFYAGFQARPHPPSPAAPACLAGYLVLLGSVLFHELGHLAACRYFGCPHGEIRIGLYLIFPVFYANVTPSWRLGRRERLIVDLGGVYFQSILLIPLFLLCRFTQEPIWQLLFLGVESMLVFALNPFLRFDGYWLCSDLLGVPNLHARARLLIGHLWTRLLIGRLWTLLPSGRIRARLMSSPLRAPSPALDIHTLERFGLVLYAFGRYLFLLSLTLLTVRYGLRHLPILPALVAKTVTDALRETARGNPAGLGAAVGRLLIFVFLALAAAGLVRKAWTLGVRLVRRRRQRG